MKFRIDYIDMKTREKKSCEKECRDHDAAMDEARKISNVYWIVPLSGEAKLQAPKRRARFINTEEDR